jgi:DNA (cytosine-5)-methyltransferase 1
MTFGSLFAGIGGLDLGLERAGMKCVWQVEKDEYCRRVLEKHWPDVRRWDDVHTFGPSFYGTNTTWERPDLICGGDPCQANSAAVGRHTSDHESLADEFVRIVAAFRPQLVLRENPSHVRRNAPWPWWRFRASLESLGYVVLPFRLRACCVGALHERERVFLLAQLPDANGNGLEGWQGQKAWQPGQPARPVEKMDWPNIPTARGFNSRAGLPTYVDEMRGIGNAVVPQVAEWIGRRIIESDRRD